MRAEKAYLRRTRYQVLDLASSVQYLVYIMKCSTAPPNIKIRHYPTGGTIFSPFEPCRSSNSFKWSSSFNQPPSPPSSPTPPPSPRPRPYWRMWRYDLAWSQRLALAAIKLTEGACKMHEAEICSCLNGRFRPRKETLEKMTTASKVQGN